MSPLQLLIGRLAWLSGMAMIFVIAAQAQTDAYLPPIGGNGGGQFNARCAQGQFLVGLELRTGDDVDAVRPLCAISYGGSEVGPTQRYPQRFGGDGGGRTVSVLCPAAFPLVTALYVQYEGATIVVNKIHLFCGNTVANQVPSDVPGAVFDGPDNHPEGGPFASFIVVGENSQRCRTGSAAVGINGRSGKWLDAVGLICGTTPQPMSSIVREPNSISSFGSPKGSDRPVYIYAVDTDGTLKWFRHDGAPSGQFNWQGPRSVGRGWGDSSWVFSGGGNIIYAITSDGTLRWFQHNGVSNGVGLESPQSWIGGKNVGRGWTDFVDVFSGGDGVIYTVLTDGTLKWRRHLAYLTGQGLETPGSWSPYRSVGRGWANYKHVFSGGNGIIYVIANDGTLKWFRHRAYLTGEGLETQGAWEGPKTVGRGWENVQQVFSGGDGIIYAVMPDGKLRWFKHVGYLDGRGLETPGAWEGPKEVGRGWSEVKNVFALLPRTPDVVR